MRHRLAIAATLTAFAGPVMAEPWIDYDLLRKLYADKVVVSTYGEGKESWSLDMGNGVTVTCWDGGCVGQDEEGAVGCAFEIVAEIKATVEACSLPIEDAKRDRLNAFYERIGKFVAENSVPSLQWTALQSYADSKVQSKKRELAAQGPSYCSEMTEDLDLMMMIDYFSSPLPEETEMEIYQMLSKPRLPVMNPCL